MGAQSLGRGVASGKLGFAQGGVDLLVADRVKQNRFARLATAQTGHEVVTALGHAGRDRATAEWTYGQGLVHGTSLARNEEERQWMRW